MNLKKEHSDLVSKVLKPAGVKELMKVYEHFEKVNTETNNYLRLLSPEKPQANSNRSFLR